MVHLLYVRMVTIYIHSIVHVFAKNEKARSVTHERENNVLNTSDILLLMPSAPDAG